ncbi:tetratricopeptide repeat protein [Desulfosporosinus sp.]|uniref:tetratricopeptide repeat protein n=1 Tax=Desulfosporosinus sp. TaxID=157907 RepID=UPI00261E67DF|nr:tetratricopeptide repeat protein [Desulfosporosinus sp.]
MVNNKKNQQITAIVIAILITISIVGAGVYGYFYEAPFPNPSAYSDNSDYSSLKNKVNTLNQEVRSNPYDIPLQQDLGNAYYDLATVAQEAAPDEVIEDYNQAITYYQKVLNTKKDINVLTDMATAAFYSGQYDLAEKSFKEALIENPDFQQALFNYGVFLIETKNDYSTAIRMWQTILDKEPNGPNSDQVRQLITQAKNAQASQ